MQTRCLLRAGIAGMGGKWWWLVCVLTLVGRGVRGAELELSPVFGDHMVLQRDKPVRIWGRAPAGSSVLVEFAERQASARADEGGQWLAQLAPLPAHEQGHDLRVSCGGAEVVLHDLLVGEVWLLGGQSNMEMPLWWRTDGHLNAPETRLTLGVDHPWLRVMTVPQRSTRRPQDWFPESTTDGDGVPTLRWFESKSRDPAISGFSALGYYLAQELRAATGVPIGLIDTSWGGTIAAAWNSHEQLESIPEARQFLAAQEAAAEAWSPEVARQEFEQALKLWEAQAAAAKAAGKNPPGKPNLRPDPAGERGFPAGPFNAMIWPLRHLAVRGVFYYQGENNYFDKLDPFAQTYPGVVKSWRQAWEEEQLPVCLIQICGWETNDRVYWQTRLPLLQVWQHEAHRALAGTGFVVTGDYPHVDIHPMVKRPIARRAVAWARAEVYGDRTVRWKTPVLVSSEREGHRLLLKFQIEPGDPLQLHGGPSGFAVAGADHKFLPARAEVVAPDTVAVWHDQIPQPHSARHVWSQRGVYRLYTSSGLPIGPFRTDDWPIPPGEIVD